MEHESDCASTSEHESDRAPMPSPTPTPEHESESESGGEPTSEHNRIELQVIERAFEGRIYAFSIVNKTHIDIKSFLDDAFHLYEPELTRIFDNYEMFKTRSVLVCEFSKKNRRCGISK